MSSSSIGNYSETCLEFVTVACSYVDAIRIIFFLGEAYLFLIVQE